MNGCFISCKKIKFITSQQLFLFGYFNCQQQIIYHLSLKFSLVLNSAKQMIYIYNKFA